LRHEEGGLGQVFDSNQIGLKDESIQFVKTPISVDKVGVVAKTSITGKLIIIPVYLV
jgi:hypothetical protein